METERISHNRMNELLLCMAMNVEKVPKIIVNFDCFMAHDSFNLIVMIMEAH